MNNIDRYEIGRLGENWAIELLSAKGYKILERNYRCFRGEIDIIAEINGEIVFVEVKTRTSKIFGEPKESVTKKKISHMEKAALEYLVKNKRNNAKCRFDVIEFLFDHLKGVI